jgi:hypothetical protein
MDATTFTDKGPASQDARRKATICIDVTYDPEATSPDKLASLYAHLVETGTLEEFNEAGVSEPECFREYGEGAIIGWRAIGSPVVVKTSDIKKLVDYDPEPDADYAVRMAEKENIPEELEAIERGDLVGYYCKAVVTLDIPCEWDTERDTSILQRIESPGLWSIFAKDDSDPYFDEIFAQERDTLVFMLRKMGIRVEED